MKIAVTARINIPSALSAACENIAMSKHITITNWGNRRGIWKRETKSVLN
jgi:hypothetical protein